MLCGKNPNILFSKTKLNELNIVNKIKLNYLLFCMCNNIDCNTVPTNPKC